MKVFRCRVVSSTLILSLLVTACAAPRSGVGTGSSNVAANDPCDTAKTAVAGAIAGALIGAINGRRNAAAGAVAGGLIGALACVAINNSSKQTRSATAVEQDYTRSRGMLPAQPQLVSYQTTVNPAGTIRPNTEVRVTSNVEIVKGATEPVREVKEEIVLYDTQHKEFKRGSKILTHGSGGSYESDWTFKLPAGVTQGQYTIQTLVYVNGQVMAQRDTHMQLVLQDGASVLARANL